MRTGEPTGTRESLGYRAAVSRSAVAMDRLATVPSLADGAEVAAEIGTACAGATVRAEHERGAKRG